MNTLTPMARALLQGFADNIDQFTIPFPDETAAAIKQALATIDERPCARCGHKGDLPFDAHAAVPTHVIPDSQGRPLTDDQIEMVRHLVGAGQNQPRIIVKSLLKTIDVLKGWD